MIPLAMVPVALPRRTPTGRIEKSATSTWRATPATVTLYTKSPVVTYSAGATSVRSVASLGTTGMISVAGPLKDRAQFWKGFMVVSTRVLNAAAPGQSRQRGV